MKKLIGSLCILGIALSLCIILASCGECDHKNMKTLTIEPTCADKGYTLYTCPDCLYTFEAEFIAPLGHSFVDTVIVPTCEKEGYTQHNCTVCGIEEHTNFVRPNTHEFVETVIAPTCDEQGYTYAQCKNCTYYKAYNFVKPTAHNYESEVTLPTCEEEGYTTYSCADCSYSYVSDYTIPTGHDYATEIVRPNLEKTGYTVYTCKTCKREHTSDFVFYSDIFTGAAGEGRGELAWGVDVSYHNVSYGKASIDWQKLKDAGVDFVIIRLGSSKAIDPKFEEFYAGAKAVGLDVGAYFYTYSLDAEGAKKDAALTIEWLKGKTLEYPIFYDIEDFADGGYYPSELPEETLMEMCHAYMSALIEANYYPGLYTNNNFLYNKYNDEKVLKLYDVWYARYPESIEGYDYSGTYSMWQYTYEGTVDGIEGICDLNMAFKDYPKIIKELKFNGYGD